MEIGIEMFFSKTRLFSTSLVTSRRSLMVFVTILKKGDFGN